jgi:hypothetical protein
MPIKDQQEFRNYVEANADSYGQEYIGVAVEAMRVIDSKPLTELLFAQTILKEAAEAKQMMMSPYHEQAIARLISDVHSRGYDFKSSLDLGLQESLGGSKNYSLWFSFLLICGLMFAGCIRGPKIEMKSEPVVVSKPATDYYQAFLMLDDIVLEMTAVGLYNPSWNYEERVKSRYVIFDALVEMVRQKKTDAEIHKALIDDLLEKRKGVSDPNG